MITLDQILTKHDCDKGILQTGVGHDYGSHYESVLAPFRNTPFCLLEIGVGTGKSIRVWLDYFTHPRFHVIGIDNDKDCFKGPLDRFTFVAGDQTDPAFWTQFQCNYGYDFAVVIDDGSHMSNGITMSFECIWPYLKSGSLYCIEDLRCAYMSGYQVSGWPNQMQLIKEFLDDINAQSSYRPGPDPLNYPNGTDGSRGIKWLRFSEELCILCKK